MSIINCNILITGHFSLNVSNSDEVIIYPQAFENTTFVGVFRNIRDLRTFSKTFSGAKDSRVSNYSFELQVHLHRINIIIYSQ